MPIPANAEFTLAAADDPYEYASAADVSCFRRPLPATNLRFLASVMWDGRKLKTGYSYYRRAEIAGKGRHYGPSASRRAADRRADCENS